MDIRPAIGPGDGKVIPAIYEFTGDTLSVCYALQDGRIGRRNSRPRRIPATSWSFTDGNSRETVNCRENFDYEENSLLAFSWR